MPSNEGHVHWGGSANETVNYLEQELQLTSEVSNKSNTPTSDPIGTIRIRFNGSSLTGLVLPTDGWQAIPDTNPILEARMDGNYPVGYVRIRKA